MSVVWALVLFASGVSAGVHTTRLEQAAGALDVYVGCCTDPDVVDYGVDLDFSSYYDGDTITTEFRPLGVLFGQALTPNADATLVRLDYARYEGCRKVLTGGTPEDFSGWEFFAFVDPVEDRWASVQKVGADIGYCDRLGACFIAAYDASGNLLEVKFNDRIGFQFLGIERPSADINCVLIGDCLGSGSHCYPDPAGSALSCLSFTPPVTGPNPLPAFIPVPDPPLVVGTPSVTPAGVVLLFLLLAGAAAWSIRRRGPSAA